MLIDKNIVRGGNPGFTERVKQKVCRFIGRSNREKINRQMQNSVKNKCFTIISQNCIGGVLYHDLGMKFLSPTINMSFDGPDFIKFVSNIQHYVSLDLKEYITDNVKYPVGHLGDIEIRFNHYASFEDAYEKWNVRKSRINFDNILVISTDRDGMQAYDCMELFDKIPYRKIMYTAKAYPQYSWSRACKTWKNKNQVGTMTGFVGLKGHRFYEKYADIVEFLNS